MYSTPKRTFRYKDLRSLNNIKGAQNFCSIKNLCKLRKFFLPDYTKEYRITVACIKENFNVRRHFYPHRQLSSAEAFQLGLPKLKGSTEFKPNIDAGTKGYSR